MRSSPFALLSILVFAGVSATAQQTSSPPPPPASSPQATTLLTQSLSALTGSATLNDVTLSGTARRIVGSDDESGTAAFKALASGAARADLTLSGGSRSEIVNLTGTEPVGSWSGPDGVSHPFVYHNLLTEPAWFFPAFAISRRLSSSGFLASYVGHESRNGRFVEHVSVALSPPSADSPGEVIQHLSQIDFFLDSSTFLPAAITFTVHPDNNALLDLPVEIDFSDYTAVSGAQVPFHVQKSLNNSLVLDLQFTSAQLNTGLSASLFNVQ
jgi:hypothetical protein